MKLLNFDIQMNGVKCMMIKRTSIFYMSFVAIIGMTLVIIGIFLACNYFKRSDVVVFFDLKGTYATFIKQARAMHISSQQKNMLTKHFNHTLQYMLDQYSHNHHVVILIRQLRLSGGVDITSVIQKRIAKRMQILKSKSLALSEVNHAS